MADNFFHFELKVKPDAAYDLLIEALFIMDEYHDLIPRRHFVKKHRLRNRMAIIRERVGDIMEYSDPIMKREEPCPEAENQSQ